VKLKPVREKHIFFGNHVLSMETSWFTSMHYVWISTYFHGNHVIPDLPPPSETLLTYLNHTASKAIGNHADKHKVQHKGKHTCVVCESVVVMHGILLKKELVIKDFSSINKN